MRYVWASPATAIGLALAVFALGRPPGPKGPGLHARRIAIVDGVLEAHGPLLGWVLAHLTIVPGGVVAITFGHVVLGRDADALDWTRAHERVHVAQYEKWGPLFLPAYVLASLWAFVRGGHLYFDNRFEREARSKAL